MLKKIIIAASMVAAIAAFVVPAAQATPALFQMEGSTLAETGNVTATGQLGFVRPSDESGITCHAHATVDLTANTGVAHQTALNLSGCHAFGPLGFVCTVSVVQVKALPTLDATTQAGGNGTLISTGLKVHNTLTGFFCPSKTIEITGGEPNLDADNDAAATKFTAGGKVTTTLGEVDAFGTLQLSTGSGTYGIS